MDKPRQFFSRFMRPAIAALAIVLATGSSGCYGRGGGLLGAVAFSAIATAAIVSAERPPRAVVIYAPPPHRGYTWQPGYWTLEDNEWEWTEGRWVRNYPGYRWSPTHWTEDPGGRWRLVPGRWIAMGPPPPATAPDDGPEEDEVAPPSPPADAPAPPSPARP